VKPQLDSRPKNIKEKKLPKSKLINPKPFFVRIFK
jgi:hypothetical protein